MSIATANVSTTTGTFYNWIQTTNQLCANLSLSILTANSTLGVTSGNAYVNGQFSANTLIALGSIQGGNNTVSNTLIVTSNVTMNTATYVAGQTVLTTGTANQIIDKFPLTSFRSAKYLLQIDTGIGHQCTEIMVLQDGGANVFITEYATLQTNGVMGTFSANISSGYVNLLVSPTQTTGNVNFERTSLSV